MKFILIYEFLSEQGGLEREIINHANFLKQEKHEVLILTCYKSKDIEKLLPFEGLKIKEISIIKTPFETINLILCFLGLNNLHKYNPDFFLSYSAPSNFLIRRNQAKKINYVNHYPHFLYLQGKEKNKWANSLTRKISLILNIFFGNRLRKIDRKDIPTNPSGEATLKIVQKHFQR